MCCFYFQFLTKSLFNKSFYSLRVEELVNEALVLEQLHNDLINNFTL